MLKSQRRAFRWPNNLCARLQYFLVNFFSINFIEFYQSWPGKGANKLQRSLVVLAKTPVKCHPFYFQEFTKDGQLNRNRTNRFTANIACVDRKVDFRLQCECRRVVSNDNFTGFVDKLSINNEYVYHKPSFSYLVIVFEKEGESKSAIFPNILSI